MIKNVEFDSTIWMWHKNHQTKNGTPNLVMPKSSHFSHSFPSSASDIPGVQPGPQRNGSYASSEAKAGKQLGIAGRFSSKSLSEFVTWSFPRLLWGWLNIYADVQTHDMKDICPLVKKKKAGKSPNLRGGNKITHVTTAILIVVIIIIVLTRRVVTSPRWSAG